LWFSLVWIQFFPRRTFQEGLSPFFSISVPSTFSIPS
jgi:hypothetical protein